MADLYVEPGGTYTNLNSAVAVATTGQVIEIRGNWSAADTNNVTWDIDVTVQMDRTSDAWNDTGVPGRANGSYQLAPTASNYCFTVTDDVIIYDLDIRYGSTTVSDELFRMSDANYNITLKRCYLGFSSSIDQQDCVYYDKDAGETITALFENCFFYSIGRAIIDCYGPEDLTIDVDFIACSSFNVSEHEGRQDGGWVGVDESNGITVNTNLLSCLVHLEENTNDYIMAGDNTAACVMDFNADLCIYNLDSSSEAAYTDTGTRDIANDYNWTEDDSKTSDGDWVIIGEVDTNPYSAVLLENDYNEAIGYHSLSGTGTNTGLSMPSEDIRYVTRSAPYSVGCYQAAAAGDTAIISVIESKLINQPNQYQNFGGV